MHLQRRGQRSKDAPTCRGVHYLLDLGTDLVGLWRADTGNSSKLNQLLAFCWRGDCIKGDWLCFNSMTLPATRNEAYSISSTGSILPEFLSSSNCVLRESFTCSPGQRSRQTSAEAAAAVAIPSMKASVRFTTSFLTFRVAFSQDHHSALPDVVYEALFMKCY